jgi:hypothetical protein
MMVLEPLSQEARSLLDEERAAAPAPAEVRDRVRGRVYASLGIGAAGAVAAKVANATPALGNPALPVAAGKALSPIIGKIIVGAVAIAGLGAAGVTAVRALRPRPAATAAGENTIGSLAPAAPRIPETGANEIGSPVPATPRIPGTGANEIGSPAPATSRIPGTGANEIGSPAPATPGIPGTGEAEIRPRAVAPTSSVPAATAAGSRSAPGTAPAAASSPATAVPRPAETVRTEIRPRPTRRRAVESVGDEALVAERRLLEDARRALGSSPATALEKIEAHERAHPRGQLVEERESLRIRALAAAGRGDEARARAARFRARYPQSLFLPAIDHTLQSLR